MLIIRIVQIWYSGSCPNEHCCEQTAILTRPSQNSLFLPSYTNSVFLHSRKRPAPATDTFFTSWVCPLTRASTVFVLCIHKIIYIKQFNKNSFSHSKFAFDLVLKGIVSGPRGWIIVQILSGMRRKGMRRSEVICLKSIGRVIRNRTNWNHVLRLATYTTGCAWWKRRYSWMKYMAESPICFCSCAVRIYLILTGYHSSVWDGR